MLKGSFDLPILFDLGATFAFALTGALAAIKRNYDIVGVLALALVTGIGGGLIRDGIFLQEGLTPLLTTPAYIYTITAATVAIPSSFICPNTPAAWGSPNCALGRTSMR